MRTDSQSRSRYDTYYLSPHIYLEACLYHIKRKEGGRMHIILPRVCCHGYAACQLGKPSRFDRDALRFVHHAYFKLYLAVCSISRLELAFHSSPLTFSSLSLIYLNPSNPTQPPNQIPGLQLNRNCHEVDLESIVR